MSQTKKAIAVIGGIFTVAIVVALIMPQDKIDQISETYKRLVGDAGIICLDYKRKSLKDPDSAKLTDTSIENKATYVITNITYKAKNSYGAFVSSKAECFIVNGAVNEVLTSNTESIKDYMQNLQEQLDCYNKLAEYRKQGKRVTDSDNAACERKQ
jgi:uncharacterized membrane protein YgaE (UPF0421/DUF939 family)